MMPDFVQSIALDPSRRVIFISDIHGHLPLFRRLLEQIQYTPDDVLVIAGDLIEKGAQSLDTLRYVSELCRRGTVYPVAGNCDRVLSNAMDSRSDGDIYEYITSRPCLIREMCDAQGLALNAPPAEIRAMIRSHYADELAWLEALPVVLVSDRFYVAHAGMNSETLSELDERFCLSASHFMTKAQKFSKPLIVGHWPTVIYQTTRIDHAVYHDAEKNIYSIDGGNVIKRTGQLNALIFNADGTTETDYADELPRRRFTVAQAESAESVHLPWPPTAVTAERTEGEFTLCRTAKGLLLWHPTERLWQSDGQLWFCDATDYQLPVRAGEELGIVESYRDRVLAKQGTRAGWVLAIDN